MPRPVRPVPAVRRACACACAALRGVALALAAVVAAEAGAATLELQALSSDGKPLPEAVVWLDSPAARAAARPRAGVEIAQSQRRFEPRITVVTPGTPVQFPNRDTVRHHVYSFSAAKKFELKLYAGTPAQPVVFDRAGIAVLGCNIHDNMVAWVVVADTPHHALADARGMARFADVPPGRYTLRAWHPGLPPEAPPLEQALELPAGGAALPAVSVRLPLSAAAAGRS